MTVEEVELLARAMTYKYCFCGYTLGGAKAGVTMPFDVCGEERRAILEKFGEHIGPLIRSKTYHPWTDMNSSVADIEAVYRGAGQKLKSSPSDSAYYTALSTFSGLMATAEHYKMPPEQCKVTIEGFGNVGENLANEIVRWGGRIVGVSNRLGALFNEKGLDLEEMKGMKARYGEEWLMEKGNWSRIEKEELYNMRMDFHIPCARTQLLDEGKAEVIGCRAVVPASNVPCTPQAERILYERQVTLLPFFVTNIGGITGSGLDSLGASDEQVRRLFLEEHYRMVLRLLKSAKKRGRSTVELAKREAYEHYQCLRMSASRSVKRKRGLMGKLAKRIELVPARLLRQKLEAMRSTFNNRFQT